MKAEKSSWFDLILIRWQTAELGMIPPPLLEGFSLPPFVTASVPSEAQWADALDWVLTKGLISAEPAYADSVDASYLP